MSRSTSEQGLRVGSPCHKCGKPLTSTLVCLECGTLMEIGEFDPFGAFGLDVAVAVDEFALRKSLVRLQRALHPDFFATKGEDARAAAERASSELNAAFEVLSDAGRRGDWIVGRLGGPTKEDERAMPQEFLLEVLEWNETLEEAREAGDARDRAALASLKDALEEARAETLEALERSLEPLPERGSDRLRDARKRLNALRYVDRALDEVARLVD
ncbi:MAG: Fe-S protein assembly co-chaperone HscB [Planctomycetota bacterium]